MKVDRNICIGCQACINNCPVGAISLKDGKAEINKDICIGCGYCKQICPVGAIKDKE